MNYHLFKSRLLRILNVENMSEEDIEIDMNEWYIIYREMNMGSVTAWAKFFFEESEPNKHTCFLKSKVTKI